jgi:subtilase family serine protease
VLGAVAVVSLGTVSAVPAGAVAGTPQHVSSETTSPSAGAKTADDEPRRLEAAAAGLPKLSQAYNVKPLWDKKIDGTGATVGVLVSYGNKDIKAVIDRYSKLNGLPPANVETLEPVGAVPSCDKAADRAVCESWGGETALDVEMIHTMAPGAKIVVLATPVAQKQGITGLPEMMRAIDYATTHKLVDVISMSFGATEETFDNFGQIRALDPAFDRASAAGITLVAASGDVGASGYRKEPKDGRDEYDFRVASWPASDPRVTAVGGTVLHLNSQNIRTKPDTVWQESGGGLSKVFATPDYQKGVTSITRTKFRTFPDITMEGVSGTSESAPLFAGVLALAVQSKHGRLGQINPALYEKLGTHPINSGIVDVTTGNNNYDNVTGYRAGKGYDIVSGWGTLNAAKFVPALPAALP